MKKLSSLVSRPFGWALNKEKIWRLQKQIDKLLHQRNRTKSEYLKDQILNNVDSLTGTLARLKDFHSDCYDIRPPDGSTAISASKDRAAQKQNPHG